MYFTLGTNSYMFRHQGAILRKLITINDRKWIVTYMLH